jgi:hypothetical protein
MDIGQEGIPIHASNEGGPLMFSIGWGYNRGLKGEDHLLEACSKVWSDVTAMNIAVNFEIQITNACKKALDLTQCGKLVSDLRKTWEKFPSQ